jgi:hypothetical protein
MECSTSRRSFTATVHVRRTTKHSVAYSPFVRYRVNSPILWTVAVSLPAYTRFAPLFKASSSRARPMPRFAPVIKIVLSFDIHNHFLPWGFSEPARLWSVPRSSEYPAFRRGHWGMGRPPGHTDTGGQSGAPSLVRVMEHCWGQPGGESSHFSCRP